eukprot:gene2673-3869_t
MGFFDKIFDNPKTSIIALGGATAAIFLGYVTYKKISQPKIENKVETKNVQIKSKINLKTHESPELLLKFSYPEEFTLGEVQFTETGCYKLQVQNLTKQQNISIICEMVDPNLSLEKFYEKNLDALKSSVDATDEKKMNKFINSNPAIYVEHLVDNRIKHWRILSKFDNRVYSFSSSEKDSEFFNLFVNSIEFLKPKFEMDKLIFHSKKGFEFNLPDTTFKSKNTNEFFNFSSNDEEISLVLNDYKYIKTAKEEIILLPNNIKAKLMTYQVKDKYHYDSYFTHEGLSYLMKASSNLPEREFLLLNSLKSLNFNSDSKKDYFTYTNSECKFSINFDSSFDYEENLQNDQFFTILSNEENTGSDLEISISKVSNNKSTNLAEKLKNDLESENLISTIKKVEKTKISGKNGGILEFEYTDEIENYQYYMITYLIERNSEYCLNIECSMIISDEEGEKKDTTILEREIKQSRSICESIQFQ